MVEPRLTPAQKIGTNPSFVAASTELPSTRAGSRSPSTCRSVNSGFVFSLPPEQLVASASTAMTTTKRPAPLRTSPALRQGHFRRLFEPAPRHLAPFLPAPQKVEKAAAPEIGDQLAVAQVLGDGIDDETSDVLVALVPPNLVLLEQQRRDRDDHRQE